MSATSLLAQEGTGGITGLVSDPQGAVVAGAQVAATNVDTQVRTATVTNSAGVYELLNLIPGTYSVEVS
ncbi:MAG: carboxypeptidase-like regulatory domain-containing protein, partial [Terriglobales bacterium]